MLATSGRSFPAQPIGAAAGAVDALAAEDCFRQYPGQSPTASIPRRGFAGGFDPFFTSALTFTAMMYAIARINWRLALVALGFSPVIFVVSRIYRRRLRRQSKEVKKIESAALSVVHEVLGAARVVKAFGQEDR